MRCNRGWIKLWLLSLLHMSLFPSLGSIPRFFFFPFGVSFHTPNWSPRWTTWWKTPPWSQQICQASNRWHPFGFANMWEWMLESCRELEESGMLKLGVLTPSSQLLQNPTKLPNLALHVAPGRCLGASHVDMTSPPQAICTECDAEGLTCFQCRAKGKNLWTVEAATCIIHQWPDHWNLGLSNRWRFCAPGTSPTLRYLWCRCWHRRQYWHAKADGEDSQIHAHTSMIVVSIFEVGNG